VERDGRQMECVTRLSGPGGGPRARRRTPAGGRLRLLGAWGLQRLDRCATDNGRGAEELPGLAFRARPEPGPRPEMRPPVRRGRRRGGPVSCRRAAGAANPGDRGKPAQKKRRGPSSGATSGITLSTYRRCRNDRGAAGLHPRRPGVSGPRTAPNPPGYHSASAPNSPARWHGNPSSEISWGS